MNNQFQESLNHFAKSLKNKGKQAATIESYLRDAQRFVQYLSDHKISMTMVEPGTLVHYQKYLREKCKERDNTIRRGVIGIRQYFRFLQEQGHISITPFDMVAIPTRDEKLPEQLNQLKIHKILDAARQQTPAIKGLRDAAIVSLICYEGLKTSEIINLHWRDVFLQDQSASIFIEGQRSRSIRLTKKSFLAFKQYADTFKQTHEGELANQHVFVAYKGKETSWSRTKMSRHGLKFIIYELGERSGLSKVNAEQLRHYAVQHLIQQGRSPEDIMQHLGLRRLGNIAKHLALMASPNYHQETHQETTSEPTTS